MFTAKKIDRNATLYRSRVTGFRYVITNTIYGVRLYINGMLMGTGYGTTRRDCLDCIEYLEGIRTA